MSDYTELCSRLESIAEHLEELGIQQLRDALETGEAPRDEKRIARARRAVLKAAAILDDSDGT